MDFNESKAAIFATIPENDAHRTAKHLHLANWCTAFYGVLCMDTTDDISFFLDVISDEECWEETNTIHRIKFNRRLAAKKMVQPLSPTGIPTPLDESDRYEIACYCCLEEDAPILLENYKRSISIQAANEPEIKNVAQFINKEFSMEPLMYYWSCIVGGCLSELPSGSKHLYEHGLNLALSGCALYVEAVEFFWNKIKELPDDEISAQQKSEIIMDAALTATDKRFDGNPEVFEFCISQMSPDCYRDLLREDVIENGDFGSLHALRSNFSFHLYQKLFDSLGPLDITEHQFWRQVMLLAVHVFPECYANEVLKLFMHIWTKNGFDDHRRYVLQNEMIYHQCQENLLVPFVKKNYMEPVWAIMDQATLNEINIFMDSEKATYIRSVLKKRRDENSLIKFLSYYYIYVDFTTDDDLLDLISQKKGEPSCKRAKFV